MAFIIRKKSARHGKERELYYLVANYRTGNKIKRKTLLKLNDSKNPAELLQVMEQEKANLTNRLLRFEKELEIFLTYRKVPVNLFYRYPSEIKKRLINSVEEAKKELEKCQNKVEEIKRYVQA